MVLVGRKATGRGRKVVRKLAGESTFLGRGPGELARMDKTAQGRAFCPGARPAARRLRVTGNYLVWCLNFDVTLF